MGSNPTLSAILVSMNVQIVDALARLVPARLGALRVWGDWFGRPFDNIHTAVAAESRDRALVIRFDNGATLTVEDPAGLAYQSKCIARHAVGENSECFARRLGIPTFAPVITQPAVEFL